MLLLKATTRKWHLSLLLSSNFPAGSHLTMWSCKGGWEVWPLSGQPDAQLEIGGSVAIQGESGRRVTLQPLTPPVFEELLGIPRALGSVAWA